jgi:hypothetical protein
MEVTDIGRKFYGSVVGLFYLGIADKYAKCNSTESGSCIHLLRSWQIQLANTGLRKIWRRVETSNPKHPGEVPDFISSNAFYSSGTVKSMHNVA